MYTSVSSRLAEASEAFSVIHLQPIVLYDKRSTRIGSAHSPFWISQLFQDRLFPSFGRSLE
jgi:hypothetical protein